MTALISPAGEKEAPFSWRLSDVVSVKLFGNGFGFVTIVSYNVGSLLVNQTTKVAQDKNKNGTGNNSVPSCLMSGSSKFTPEGNPPGKIITTIWYLLLLYQYKNHSALYGSAFFKIILSP